METITIKRTNIQCGANDFARTFSLVCDACPIGAICAEGLQDDYGMTRLSACEYLDRKVVSVVGDGVFSGKCTHSEIKH